MSHRRSDSLDELYEVWLNYFWWLLTVCYNELIKASQTVLTMRLLITLLGPIKLKYSTLKHVNFNLILGKTVDHRFLKTTFKTSKPTLKTNQSRKSNKAYCLRHLTSVAIGASRCLDEQKSQCLGCCCAAQCLNFSGYLFISIFSLMAWQSSQLRSADNCSGAMILNSLSARLCLTVITTGDLH